VCLRVDWDTQQVTYPQGHQSRRWRPSHDTGGQSARMFCPSSLRCVSRTTVVHEGRNSPAYDETASPSVKRSPASSTTAANTAVFQQRYAQRVSATRLDCSHRKFNTLAGVVGEAVRRRRRTKRALLQCCSYCTTSHGVHLISPMNSPTVSSKR